MLPDCKIAAREDHVATLTSSRVEKDSLISPFFSPYPIKAVMPSRCYALLAVVS